VHHTTGSVLGASRSRILSHNGRVMCGLAVTRHARVSATTLTAWLMLAALMAPAVAAAQATISGCVKDSHGGVLPGVEVVASNADRTARAVTDIRGCYQLRDVTIGTYSVTAKLAGFSPAKREGVAIVAAGATIDALDFTLCIAAMAEIDWVFPAGGLRELWAKSEAVVHLRISSTTDVRTECPGRNDFAHVATVISVVKDATAGPLGSTLTFRQENWSGERVPYAVGEEMIVFLNRDLGEWRRLIGPHSVFRIKGREVFSPGWLSETAGLTPEALVTMLRSLPR
jgi:hypothetical protein